MKILLPITFMLVMAMSVSTADAAFLAKFGTNVPNGSTIYGNTATFDLYCGGSGHVQEAKIWADWMGYGKLVTNQTNSTPVHDKWWNATVSGIPAGTWTWRGQCNYTPNTLIWAVGGIRTFTIISDFSVLGTDVADGAVIYGDNVKFDISGGLHTASVSLYADWGGAWSLITNVPSVGFYDWKNITISGIPAGTWTWGGMSLDSSGDILATSDNRSFTFIGKPTPITVNVPLASGTMMSMLMGAAVIMATLTAGAFASKNMDVRTLVLLFVMMLVGLSLAVTLSGVN